MVVEYKHASVVLLSDCRSQIVCGLILRNIHVELQTVKINIIVFVCVLFLLSDHTRREGPW